MLSMDFKSELGLRATILKTNQKNNRLALDISDCSESKFELVYYVFSIENLERTYLTRLTQENLTKLF